MRTTLTIEDDIASKLIEIKSKNHKSLKNVVNSLLRSGIEQLDKIEEPTPHYSITSVNLGSKLPDLDNISEILAQDEKELE